MKKSVDRIEAMTAFVAAVDAGGLSAATRVLGRSPASITRAVDMLEERTGAQLLRRSTRAISLTEAGQRYLAACRRVLDELAAAEQAAVQEQAKPRGLLAVTAPSVFGRIHIRPIVDAYLKEHPDVQVRFVLLDRNVNIIDEGIDVAIRIGHLPDSTLMATRVGEVRRVICASPSYLARHKKPVKPSDLASHDCISFSQVTPTELWSFARRPNQRKARPVKVHVRLSVNGAETAIGSALGGLGITAVLSYQVERELADGSLVRLLPQFEPEPLPVHVVTPAASRATAKVRAFVDMAVPHLRSALTGLQ